MATVVEHDHTLNNGGYRRFALFFPNFPNLRISTEAQLDAYAKANAAATGHDENLVTAEVKEAGPPTIITVTFTIEDPTGEFSVEGILAKLKHDSFQDALNKEIAKDDTINGFEVSGLEDPESIIHGKLLINTTLCI